MIIAALVLSAFALNSCEEDRWGFDNKVVFSAAGGEEDVDGDASIASISIGTGLANKREATDFKGTLTVTYDWLTAVVAKGDNEVHLIALPNKTGKDRKLYVYGTVNSKMMNITVIQKK